MNSFFRQKSHYGTVKKKLYNYFNIETGKFKQEKCK